MVFSGIPFLYFFLTAALILYGIAPTKIKNYVLLAFSLVFYAWGEPVYILLMIFSTLCSWLCGLFMAYRPSQKKLFLILSVIINIGLLGFFKYTTLFVSTANSLFSCSLPLPKIVLPIGISFYTFQTMSYTIDVYRGDTPAQKNFFLLMTYISMFPQLIAGPIVRYETIANELQERKVTWNLFCDGMIRFLQGLFKKVLLANTIGELFDAITATAPENHALTTLWLGIIAYYFHIYFDFSGYSDMAIGMGKMLGFSFLENFNYPMIARSVSDFWRRWHVSLTTWFRDYVYIPLGGSRCSKIKCIRNVLIVWMLTGFWHGASWNFLVWGLYFGVILVLEKNVWGKALEKIPSFFRHLYTTVLVTIGWAIFSLEDFSVMAAYIRRMFVNETFIDRTFFYYAIPYLPIMAAALCFAVPLYPILSAKLEKSANGVKAAVGTLGVFAYGTALVLSVSFLVGNSYNPFLYFRF